jgi:hypothetical protein
MPMVSPCTLPVRVTLNTSFNSAIPVGFDIAQPTGAPRWLSEADATVEPIHNWRKKAQRNCK